MSFTNEIELYVYDAYIELGDDAYLEKVLYYETHKQHILNLPFNQTIEIHCDYLEALHQTNKYYKVLEIIDDVIASIISENIYTINLRNGNSVLIYTLPATQTGSEYNSLTIDENNNPFILGSAGVLYLFNPINLNFEVIADL